MSGNARWSAAALLILLLFVGVFNQDESWELTPSTHGSIPAGYGALYRMLMKLDLSDGRSYEHASHLPADATVWWIEPGGLCQDVEAAPLREGKSGVWRALDWIDRGGTGVVFLPATPVRCLADATLAGAPLPTRAIDRMTGEEWADIDPRDLEPATLVGDVLRGDRSLEIAAWLRFDHLAGFESVVADDTGRAFAVMRTLGKGRLVLVGGATPLRNRSLDRADAAPFGVDLALAFGRPLFDEREHGLLPSPSPVPYLLQSVAFPSFSIAALLACVALWRRRAELAPKLEPGGALSPSLEAYVDSVAALYSSTRDHAEVLRCYQEFALSQLRRLFLLPPDSTPKRVCDRLRASPDFRSEDAAVLLETPSCRGRAEQLAAVARLDAILVRAAR